MTLYPDPLDPLLNDPLDAAWEAGGRVHNWQNHIGPRLRQVWSTLNDTMKTMLAYDAQDRADNEDWD
jgi:hypothetical protein